MAFQSGTYNDQNDAVNLLATFATGTAGWTQNLLADDSSKYSGDVFTGRRLHLQKSINGQDYFLNLRSCSNQRVFSYASYEAVTGICVNGSTGYNVANVWDAQPGYTDRLLTSSSTNSTGGCVDSMIETGGTYHFFSTPTSIHAAFSTESTYSDWRFLSFGATSKQKPLYICSGGRATNFSNGDPRSSFLCDFTNQSYTASAGLYRPGTGWYLGARDADLYTVMPCKDFFIGSDTDGSYMAPYLSHSPDPLKGNAPLPPTSINIADGSLSIWRGAGVLDGINWINMKNYANEQDIVIGSDTFKCFSITNDTENDRDQIGVAFKK
jgi:hypothetical protein